MKDFMCVSEVGLWFHKWKQNIWVIYNETIEISNNKDQFSTNLFNFIEGFFVLFRMFEVFGLSLSSVTLPVLFGL